MSSSRPPISTLMPPPSLAGGGSRATYPTRPKQDSSTASRPAPETSTGFQPGPKSVDKRKDSAFCVEPNRGRVGRSSTEITSGSASGVASSKRSTYGGWGASRGGTVPGFLGGPRGHRDEEDEVLAGRVADAVGLACAGDDRVPLGKVLLLVADGEVACTFKDVVDLVGALVGVDLLVLVRQEAV